MEISDLPRECLGISKDAAVQVQLVLRWTLDKSGKEAGPEKSFFHLPVHRLVLLFRYLFLLTPPQFSLISWPKPKT